MGVDLLCVEFAADAASIGGAREAARRLAGLCGANPDDLALAASEAVTNALVDGYRNGAGGTIELRGYQDGSDCVLEVSDSGVGMRPHPGSPGLRLGLPVITAVAGSVEIESVGTGTAVRMRFPRAG